MSAPASAADSRPQSTRPTPAVWWLVFKQEFTELWVGGRVLNFLVLFSLLMSMTAFLLATNNELSLLPLKQTVVVALTSAITFGLFIGLIIAAESISGERERATLETLLLTPASHRQIVLGKFLVALSPWPAALILSIPYIAALAQGDAVLGQALIWGAIMGSLLAMVFIGFGMLVSIWSNSNRISLFVSLLLYVMLLIPAQLPTEFQNSPAGVLVAALDPLEAARQFMSKTLMEGRPVNEVSIFVIAPAVLTVLIMGLLFLYAAPRLHLEAGTTSKSGRNQRPAEAIE
ncbi:MAG: ABC transporter permease subunit [Chloroflexi bacterium]|nr:ABC transporter permease subunit [Chloroflexota bacterium]